MCAIDGRLYYDDVGEYVSIWIWSDLIFLIFNSFIHFVFWVSDRRFWGQSWIFEK